MHAVKDDELGPFLCPCLEMCYLRRESAGQFADFTRTYRFTLVTQELSTLTTQVLRMWYCSPCSTCTNHFFFFLRLWVFVVWLAVPSKPSSQPIWLKV